MSLILKLFSHCETYCSNNSYILNDFYIVRLVFRTQSNYHTIFFFSWIAFDFWTNRTLLIGKIQFKFSNIFQIRVSNASVISSSAHPPRADPRALGFLEAKRANAPRRGQTSCSNGPPYRYKISWFLSFLRITLVLIKAKWGQTKSQISLISLYCSNDHSFCLSAVSFCHS